MVFSNPNKIVLFPTYEMENILRKIVPSYCKDDTHIVAFLFEIYEEYRQKKVSPHKAFITILEQWNKKYKNHPFVLEQINIYIPELASYLAQETQREQEQLQQEEHKNALKKHISMKVSNIPLESKATVGLTK